jgi:hypothetical protein
VTVRYTNSVTDAVIEVKHALYAYDAAADWDGEVVDEAAEAADAAVAEYLEDVEEDDLDDIATDQSVTWTGTPDKAAKVLQLIAALHAAI